MHTTVTVIGAGQAGLAMSRCLTDRSIDHVLLERGEVANSWRTERWDSLRLLTPNWMSRLPGHRYDGEDPDGYMTATEVVGYLDGYRRSFEAPVRTGTAVESVRTTGLGFETTTTTGVVDSRAVVVATGACSTPRIPAIATALPARIQQITPIEYRSPDGVAPGRVLVVGASASGVQIADELRSSGRDVVLAAGDHVRLPRTYRGMDILWWMEALGRLDERYDQVDDIARARRAPSLQLVGSPERRSLDLGALHAGGVQCAGRLEGVSGSAALFSGAVADACAKADLGLGRLLDAIDEHARRNGLDAELGPPDRPGRSLVTTPVTMVDLGAISAVVWATGFRPHFPFLEPDLVDREGAVHHEGGVMARPGMYALGLRFARRRKSNFLDGVGPDALELTDHLAHHLDAVSSGAVARR